VAHLMQIVIEEVLKVYGEYDHFMNQEDFYMKLEMKHYDDLVIEKHAGGIYIAHYFEQNGDRIPDPEIEYDFPTWTMLAVTQAPPFNRRKTKFIWKDDKQYVDTKFDSQVGPLNTMWARNIRAQGWKDPSKTTLTVEHDYEVIAEIEEPVEIEVKVEQQLSLFRR